MLAGQRAAEVAGAGQAAVRAAVLSDGQIALIVDCDAVAEMTQPRGVAA